METTIFNLFTVIKNNLTEPGSIIIQPPQTNWDSHLLDTKCEYHGVSLTVKSCKDVDGYDECTKKG